MESLTEQQIGSRRSEAWRAKFAGSGAAALQNGRRRAKGIEGEQTMTSSMRRWGLSTDAAGRFRPSSMREPPKIDAAHALSRCPQRPIDRRYASSRASVQCGDWLPTNGPLSVPVVL